MKAPYSAHCGAEQKGQGGPGPLAGLLGHSCHPGDVRCAQVSPLEGRDGRKLPELPNLLLQP